ncbi:transcription elongation factor subunit Spt4 [Infirmifilum sp. NZ]|uniref:transcription elongation factor subunit Spt4 n=1 Tax=Infirmifilum sp. NZ TaxID=2926850 RepID=UPI000CAE2525|nr:transcription elongation factor subunit Spt4 [Infirmifilum sp. NZ]PLJ77685.1 MAG: DNA-binding protein [Thermofilum sp. NZ13]UNQ72543.1 DNA-directed RNA polymerase, subunit E'' [Infirmifilum sp. NZ]
MPKRKLPLKACTNCKALLNDDVEVCPVCGGREFSDDWDGFVAVVDVENSQVAKLLGIRKPGIYALKVR